VERQAEGLAGSSSGEWRVVSCRDTVIPCVVSSKELPDGLNFGLYLPPCNGRAGKFLDECRCLREYPLNGPVSQLDVSRPENAQHLLIDSFVDDSSSTNDASTRRYISSNGTSTRR
jgi:hypothetical protein